MAFLTLKTRFSAQIQLALRVAIAAALAFWIADALQLPQGFWAVITAVMVMQASLGASLQAAFDRLMGTLAGAAWGGFVAVALGASSTAEHIAEIGIALIPLAFLAALYPAFRVAPVTALIVMLPNPLVALPLLEAAMDRVLEIALGNAVGLAVALLILPARAQGAMAHAAARICELNAELMKAHFAKENKAETIAAIHARIRASLKQCEAAAEEARRERAALVSTDAGGEPLLRTLYRVRHDLVMIGRAAANAPPEARAAAFAAAADLAAIASALKSNKAPVLSDGLAPALKSLALEVDTHRTDTDPGRIYALRFAFEQLGQNLEDLAQRVRERGSI